MTVSYDMHLLDWPERLDPQWKMHRDLSERSDELRHRPDDDAEKQVARKALEACPDPHYLCLNIHAMARVRAAMGAAGMLSLEGTPLEPPAWGHLPGKTLDGETFHPDSYHPDDLCTPEQVTYQVELDRSRRYRPDGNVGIAVWKLQSNDYWIVTSGECTEALRAWDSLPIERQRATIAGLGEDGDAHWRQWLEYLRLGADGDGFMVE